MRPDDRKYLASHEWAKLDGDTVLVGITDFAVEELSARWIPNRERIHSIYFIKKIGTHFIIKVQQDFSIAL